MIFTAERHEVDGALKLVESLLLANDASEFCRAIVHSALTGDSACAARLYSLSSAATLSLAGSYGYNTSPSQTQEISIWGNSMIANAVRQGDWLVCKDAAEKSKIETTEIFTQTSQSIIAIPLFNGVDPVGCVCVEFLNPIDRDSASQTGIEILKSFSHLALNKFTADHRDSSNWNQSVTQMTPEQIIASLTERQKKVLIFIAGGYTNFRIGRTLNLSESAIKQETVKIYRKLGVKTRKEAARIVEEFQLSA